MGYLVTRYALQAAARQLLPQERVANCLRLRVFHAKPVDVLYAPAVDAAHYGNLTVCGSVWSCPVCASKISERRREELGKGLEQWPNTLLMTFTLRHSENESCDFVLDGLLRAHRAFWSGSPAERFRARYGIFGQVRALEVTYGASGWHAHLHVLLFLDRLPAGRVAMESMRLAAVHRWQKVLSRYDRFASVHNGLDLRGADDFASDYLAKFGLVDDSEWSQAHEMAKAHLKASRGDSRTPNRLLWDYFAGDEVAGELWREYALSFKGKTQLRWSVGLRGRLGLAEETSDEEIVSEQEQMAIILAQLELPAWRAVLGNDIRAELLEVASMGDQVAVKQFLDDFGIEADYPGLLLQVELEN